MPPKLNIPAGQKYGRWTARLEAGRDPHGAVLIECICDCGKVRPVKATALSRGDSRSCGCTSADAQVTHGMSRSSLYMVWRGMLSRTECPSHKHYENYGGRGIVVCDRWHQFSLFAKDMSPGYRHGLHLDRVDNNGPYAPDNCHWVTPAENQRNKRTNHVITWRGRTLVATDWAVLLGLKPNTLIYRLRRGWTVERALSTGVDPSVLLELANGGDT